MEGSPVSSFFWQAAELESSRKGLGPLLFAGKPPPPDLGHLPVSSLQGYGLQGSGLQGSGLQGFGGSGQRGAPGKPSIGFFS